MNLKKYLDDSITEALVSLGVEDGRAIVKQAQKAEFGHYQANGVMAAAKKLKTNPRELAQQLVESILAYALGRTIEFSDGDDVEALLAKLKADDYRVGSMIREIALSPLFKQK